MKLGEAIGIACSKYNIEIIAYSYAILRNDRTTVHVIIYRNSQQNFLCNTLLDCFLNDTLFDKY